MVFFVLAGCESPESAKQNGVDYLEQKSVDASVGMLLEYINRVYAAGIDYSKKEDKSEKEENTGDVFVRLSDPEKAISQEVINGINSGIDRLTLTALYCDKLGLKADFFVTLDKYIAIDGYTLTHSGIALGWANENGCLNSEQQKSYSEKTINRLREYINKADYFYDKVITATAILGYIGGNSEINKEWINEIVACQNDDGGWPRSCRIEQGSNDNATAFALWALSAYEQKDVPKRWLRHKKP